MRRRVDRPTTSAVQLPGRWRRPMRTLVLAAAMAAASLPVSAVIGATPAWAASCEDESRGSAREIAETGTVAEPSPVDPVVSTDLTVTLRYSDSYGCGWALVSGSPGTLAWIDRSEDGGTTWQGPLGKRAIPEGDGNTYTAAYRAGGDTSYSLRACGQSYFEGELAGGARPSLRWLDEFLGSQEVTRFYGEPLCTDWFPQSQGPIDWTVVEGGNFIGPNGEDLPLRIGEHDVEVPRKDGFGIRHIEDGHEGYVPDLDRIERALASCRPEYDSSSDTWECAAEGLLVYYTERVDTRSPDGRSVGILTAFEP